jgi:hypothetical protein
MSDGLRKAALALSSLAPGDRAWMLARLDDEQRLKLTALLDELRTLGLEADRALSAELCQEPPARTPAATDPRALYAVLEDEPDWMIALVLRVRPGPWREDLLGRLGTERRLGVQHALPADTQVGPKALEALAAAIDRRLQEQSVFTVKALPSARKRSWRERLTWRS